MSWSLLQWPVHLGAVCAFAVASYKEELSHLLGIANALAVRPGASVSNSLLAKLALAGGLTSAAFGPRRTVVYSLDV